MAKSNKASKLKLNKLGNAKNALELRKKGLNYAEIAVKLEISKTHAHRLVMEAMLDLDEQVKDEAEKLRSLEISRLDSLLQGLWAKAKRGHVLAVDRVLKIMERRSKFLGLDAPVKLAHGGDKSMDAINIDINELTNESLQNIAQASCD